MKRTYEEPKTKFVKTRGAEAVADTCWGHAANNSVLYFDTSGPGYAEVAFGTNGGCDEAYILSVKYVGGATEDKRSEIDAAFLKSKDGKGNGNGNGNSAEPFHGSPFMTEPGKWS